MMARAFMLTFSGTLAVLATSSVVCLQTVVATHIEKPALRSASILAVSLESVLFVILCWLAASKIWQPGKVPSSRWLKIAFGFEILACTLASAAAAVALAYLSQSKAEDDEAGGDAVLAACEAKLLVASSVAVALAMASQLLFMILHFVSSRRIALGRTPSPDTDTDSQRTPNFNVKSIRYSQTNPNGERAQEMASVERKSSAPSAVIKSKMGTISSFRNSVSQAIRPSSSKTKLLSTRERRRPASLDSTPGRSSAENSFDSWDTSSVDAHNRQVVLEMASPPLKSRGLETIPASPMASRSPSPGTALDLEPPRSLRRSRSYSASTLRQLEEARLTPTSSANELHIHPLFRSDSPTPPPVVTPGTSVLASPNAGQVISRRESMQSLNRKRSGSLPAGRSPLSRQASFDSTKLRKQGEQGCARGERKMTPPVPEWLLSPGMQASLAFVQAQAEAEEEAEAEAEAAAD